MEAVRSARQRISDEAQRHGGLDALMPGMLSTTGGLDSSARSPGRASAASHGAGGRRTSHSGGGGTGAGGGSVISATPLEQVRVLEEARKLERIQERQKRELERLMDEEMRLSALRSQSERTSQMRSGADGASEVGLAAKRRAEAEERRLREQKRRLAEEQAEEQKRHMVQQAKNKEAALMQEAQRKAAEKAREVAERDLIRQQKAAEHRRDAEAKTREREKQILERMAVLQHAEAVRTAKAERESAERERDAEQRRAAAEERIRLSQEQTATVERLRVEALHDKEAKAEQRRLERERRAEADKASKAQESFLETQKRALLLAEARREEETRKAIMEARTAAEAETLRRMHDDADRELALKRERSRLEDLAKADAIERTRLKEQYRRSHLMRVVEERESHTAEVRNQRAETQHLRREIAAKANLQREMVMHAMEAARLKKNWKEARAELEGIMAAGTQQLLKSAGLEPDALKQFNAAAAARHKSSGGAGASSSGAGAVASAGSSGDEDSGHLEAQLQHEQFMQQQAQMQAQLQAQMQAHMQQHLQMPVHGQFVSGSAGGGGYMDAAQRAFDDAVAEAAAAGGGSGTGSTLSHTTTTRVVLEMLIFRHGVMRLLDAPCGSAHWWPPLLRRLQAFQPGFSYTGVDVVESVVAGNRKLFADEFPEASFYSADLSQAALPVSEFDMALCRDALQHLPLEVAVDVIANIARAKPRFAAFGSYIENNVDRGNAEIRVGESYLINLRLAPFNMTGTVDVLNENSPNSRERKYLLLYSNEYLQSLDFEAMKARAREGAAAFKSKARRAQVVVQRGGQRGLLDGGLLEAMT